ncbi:MAG: SAM-dependent methyltransferase [Nitrososphaerales archaeon]
MSLAPFVPSPPEVIRKMLEVASVSEEDTLYDLGSGNGAMLVVAARDFGAKCVGIEMRKDLAEKALDEARKHRVEDRIKILNTNLFEVDISDADVVTLYLTSSGNLKLKSKLEKELKDKARIVSHDFEIGGWTPYKVLRGDPPGHTIYLYVKGI